MRKMFVENLSVEIIELGEFPGRKNTDTERWNGSWSGNLCFRVSPIFAWNYDDTVRDVAPFFPFP